MADKIHRACDSLQDGLDKMAENLQVIEHAPEMANAYLVATKTELERLRQDTTKKVEEALEVVRAQEEDLTAARAELEETKAQLFRLRREHTVARSETAAVTGGKRWGQGLLTRSDEGSAGPVAPPRRLSGLVSGIEEFSMEEPPPSLTFRAPSERMNAVARIQERRAVNHSALYTPLDDMNGAARLEWLLAHSRFEGSWSTDDRVKWNKQMADLVAVKDLKHVTHFIDEYAVGDKRSWPPTPRPCFFGRVKHRSCSSGGEKAGRADCPFCKIIPNEKKGDQQRAKVHCTALLVEGVHPPFGNRDGETGTIDFTVEYKADFPFFDAEGARYAWTVHA